MSSRLQVSGRRDTHFMVDALRYELGVELQQQLAEEDPLELIPAFSPLPSITLVGMASLLPEAGKRLTLASKDDGFVPMMETEVLASVNQRMERLRKQYGDRFAD